MTMKIDEVIAKLRPNGGYFYSGEAYEGITFIDCDPFTKKEFEATLADYDNWKAAELAEIEVKKSSAQAKLEALGLTSEDLKALGL